MNITQALHRTATQHPDRVATIDGARTRTYAELLDRTARLGSALGTLGAGPGQRVAILGLNSDRFLESMLGVLWAGAALNPVNIRWNAEEIAYSLADSDTALLIVDDAFAALVPGLLRACPSLHTVIHCGDGPTPDGMAGFEALIAAAEPVEAVEPDADELAGVFYTGGTTGFPKGVMLSHTNLFSSAMGGLLTRHAEPMVEDYRYLHAMPMFHLAGIGLFLVALIRGGTHVLIPFFNPPQVLRVIAELRINETALAPIMIQLLLDQPDFAEHDLTCLVNVNYGAAPMPESLLRRAIAGLPGVQLTQAYGMTELSPLATLLLPADHHDAARLRSAGRPCVHADVRVVDEQDAPVPGGTIGEIVCRGPHVMLGYWNRPAETAAVLRNGWMHTGDLGFLDGDGYLHVVDRLKDMIVSGGENVYSAEVENAIATHPAVAGCAVIGVPDDRWGERVHAVVVLREGTSVTEDAIREHARLTIAGYKCPRSVEFVDSLPLSSTNKVLKTELRDRLRHRETAASDG
ncbi:long-chain-fatty-acid--CoA ligase [Solihabitans fulvus]|uniref:Long-chain-fatty-acid--CoA ligase n=1 Tax=Solihabitans fulvus TaxID=1892852 RepID=A0A5B2WUJ4_9PSEU|nr:long-chain-fatty-acid--CoA ligase [Solihabitans fulvus]KAA2255205.1 long-chain-fatty-acid--CoA ligase [Solihabitans fulvus]